MLGQRIGGARPVHTLCTQVTGPFSYNDPTKG